MKYILKLFLFFVAILSSLSSYSRTVTYDDEKKDGLFGLGGNNTNWSEKQNWNPDGVPTADDDVVIPTGYIVVLNNNYTIKSLTVAAGATLKINGSRSLTVTGAVVINGTLTASGDNGAISGASVTISGTLDDNGKILTVGGPVTVLDGGSINAVRTIFSGDVTLNSGATLTTTPNQSDVQFRQNLTIGSGAYYNHEKGNNAKETVITGTLTLNGTMRISGTAQQVRCASLATDGNSDATLIAVYNGNRVVYVNAESADHQVTVPHLVVDGQTNSVDISNFARTGQILYDVSSKPGINEYYGRPYGDDHNWNNYRHWVNYRGYPSNGECGGECHYDFNVYYYINGACSYPGKNSNKDVFYTSSCTGDLYILEDITVASGTSGSDIYIGNSEHQETMFAASELNCVGCGVIRPYHFDNIVCSDPNYKTFCSKQEQVATTGDVYFLKNNDGKWDDIENWALNSPTGDMPARYPGEGGNVNDEVVITYGNVVYYNLDIPVTIKRLTLGTKLVIGAVDASNPNTGVEANPDAVINVTESFNGNGTLQMPNLNNINFSGESSGLTFYAKGTTILAADGTVGSMTFGNLVIGSGTSSCETIFTDDVVINKNLSVRADATLTIGRRIESHPYTAAQLTAAAQAGKSLREAAPEYAQFHRITVGGDITIDDDGVLQATTVEHNSNQNISTALREMLNAGVKCWSEIEVSGNVTVRGKLLFAEPFGQSNYPIVVNDIYTSMSGPLSQIDRMGRINFVGSKPAEFSISGEARLLGFSCAKSENVQLSVVKSTLGRSEGVLRLAAPVNMPLHDHTDLPVVLKSGVLRLGNGIHIEAWGSALNCYGEPIYMPTLDVYSNASDIPVWHKSGQISTSTIAESFSAAYNIPGAYRGAGYHINNKDNTSLSVADVWKESYRCGIYVPANAKLIIEDGAIVENHSAGCIANHYAALMWDKNSTELDKFKNVQATFGHTFVEGSLVVGDGGSLSLPNYSIGIIYGDLDSNIAGAANITFAGGNEGVVETSRIWGLHGRKANIVVNSGKLSFNKRPSDKSINPNLNSYFNSYGNPYGTIFSMKSGGTFIMNGGEVNMENSEFGEVNALDLLDFSNCEGSSNGGDFNVVRTSNNTYFNKGKYQGKLYAGKVRFWNLRVIGATKAEFFTDANATSSDGELYINNDLVVGYDPSQLTEAGKWVEGSTLSYLGTPKNIYVGGNVNIQTVADAWYPLYVSGHNGDKSYEAEHVNVTFFGDKNSDVVVAARNSYGNCHQYNPQFYFNDVVVDKDNEDFEVVVSNSFNYPLYIRGSLSVITGKLKTAGIDASYWTSRGHDANNVYGIVLAGIDQANPQYLEVSEQGDMSDAFVSLGGDDLSRVVLKSDVVLKYLRMGKMSNGRIVDLGVNNMKLLNFDSRGGATAHPYFMTTGKNYNDGGLTVPVKSTAMIMDMATPNGDGVYYSPVTITPSSAVSGYMTVNPVHGYHQTLDRMYHGQVTKYYFHTSWAGNSGYENPEGIFTFTFGFPQEIDIPVRTSADEYGSIKKADCWAFKIEDLGWEPLKYNWYDKSQATHNVTVENSRYHSADFISGHGLKNAHGTMYYSYRNGRWFDDIWTVNPDGSEDYVLTRDADNNPLSFGTEAEARALGLELVHVKHTPTLNDGVTIDFDHEVTTPTGGQSRLEITSITLNSGKLIVEAGCTDSQILTVIDGVAGTLEYRVNDPNYYWTLDITDYENNRSNFLKGDHTRFLAAENSHLIFRNEGNSEFYLPYKIASYPNLDLYCGSKGIKLTTGNSTVKIKSNLNVHSGNFKIDPAVQLSIVGETNVDGAIATPSNGGVVKFGGDINISSTGDFGIAANADSKTSAIICRNVKQNGKFMINGKLSFEGGYDTEIRSTSQNSEVGIGNATSVISLNKKLPENHVTIYTKVTPSSRTENADLIGFVKKTTIDPLGVEFTRGVITFDNAKTVLPTKNADSSRPFIEIPRESKVEALGGAVLYLNGEGSTTGWETAANTTANISLRLSGTLSVGSGAYIMTNNGIGYSEEGDARIDVGDNATLMAQQLAPIGSSGFINLNLSGSSKLVLTTEKQAWKMSYGGLLGDFISSIFNNFAPEPDDATVKYNENWGSLCIYDGNVNIAEGADVKINSVCANDGSEKTKATLYFNPTISNLGTSSKFTIDLMNSKQYQNRATGSGVFIYAPKMLEGLNIARNTKTTLVGDTVAFNGGFVVENGASFNTNNYNVHFKGNATINGSYNAGTNTTFISGDKDQTIGGTSALTFYNLYKITNHLTTLNNNTTITNAFYINANSGILDVRGNAIQFTGSTATVGMNSTLDGNGIRIYNSSAQVVEGQDHHQTLNTSGVIKNLIVDNVYGVDATQSPTEPLHITGKLKLSRGNLMVSSKSVLLDVNASIVDGIDGHDFKFTNMIATTGSVNDNGVTKRLASGTANFGDLYFPIGSSVDGMFMPTSVSATHVDVSSDASFTVIPAHNTYVGFRDIADHVLNDYWQINTKGIDAETFAGTIKFVSPESSSVTGNTPKLEAKGLGHTHDEDGCTHAGYARAFLADGSQDWQIATTPDAGIVEYSDASSHIFSSSNDNWNYLTFTFDKQAADGGLAGVYSAGCHDKLPRQAFSYINLTDGGWDDAIWHTLMIVDGNEVIGENAVALGDQVVNRIIKTGTTVTASAQSHKALAVEIQSGATLDLGNTYNHVFQRVNGKGKIRVTQGNMPTADFTNFCSTTDGGTFEFGGNNINYTILNGISNEFYNIILSGTGKRILRDGVDGANVKVYGSLTLANVAGDASDCPEFVINASSGDFVVMRDVTINNGSITGTGYVHFNGSAQQQTIHTSLESVDMAGIKVNNTRGLTIDAGKVFNLLSGLKLLNGVFTIPNSSKVVVLNADYSAVSSNNPSSYVDGWLCRKMVNTYSYEFPVGNNSRFGLFKVQPSSTSIWGVRYYGTKAPESLKGNDEQIYGYLGNEYWAVSQEEGATDAIMTLSWNGTSTVTGETANYSPYCYNSGSWSVAPHKSIDVVRKSVVTNDAFVSNTISSNNIKYFTHGTSSVSESSWTGEAVGDGTNWFNVDNWADRKIPTLNTIVTIPEGRTNYPVIKGTGQTAVAAYIYMTGTSPDVKLTVSAGASLYVMYGVYVENNTTPRVVINHTATSMASFRVGGTKGNVIVGTKANRSSANQIAQVQVNKTLYTGVFYYTGSATSEGTFDGLTCGLNTSDTDLSFDQLRSFNYRDEQYSGVSQYTGFTNTGTLYLGYTPGVKYRKFTQTGTIKKATESQTFSLKLNTLSDTPTYGWNLLHNPYQFAFPLNKSVFSSDDISTIYFRRYNTQDAPYCYEDVTYSLETGAKTNWRSKDALNIAPQQGFFVLTHKEQNFVMNPAKVPTAASTIRNTRLKSAEVEPDDILYLSVSSNNPDVSSDQLAMVFREGGSLAANGVDAVKRRSDSGRNLMCQIKGKERYVITLNPAVNEVEADLFPISVQIANGSTTGVIRIDNPADFNEEVDVLLYDFVANEVAHLREGEYQFDAQAGQYIDNRFAIALKSLAENGTNGNDDDTPTSIANNAIETVVLISGNDDNEAVVMLNGNIQDRAVVNIYDILGRLVSQNIVNTTVSKHKLGDVAGIYIVEVKIGNVTKRAKLQSK